MTFLTRRDKAEIRRLPCAMCGGVPPFADGSPCHVHRVVRGRDGGLYVRENVVPLCPSCHRKVDRVAAITGASRGGRIGGAAGAHRQHELYPELAAASMQKGRAHYPEVFRECGKRMGPINLRATNDRRKRGELTDAELDNIRAAAAGISPEQRRAFGHKGGKLLASKQTPEERIASVRHANNVRWSRMTPSERVLQVKKQFASYTSDKRSDAMRRGWETRRARMSAATGVAGP